MNNLKEAEKKEVFAKVTVNSFREKMLREEKEESKISSVMPLNLPNPSNS